MVSGNHDLLLIGMKNNKYLYLAISIVIVGLSIYGFFGLFDKGESKIEIDSNDVKTSADNVVINIEDKNMYEATMKTNMGDIVLELYKDKAPVTVDNFIKLASEGFYNGTKFHRVIKGFMIQGGDPNSKLADWSTHGTGGPGYQFKDEFNDVKLVAGVLAMANSGPNTNGSQFFIVTAEETPWLDGRHTAFGRVTAGMDIVKKIEVVATGQNDHPLEDVVVEGVVIK
jgi:cyclophilin family peptidyl-prolyl cis-trans isomerase